MTEDLLFRTGRGACPGYGGQILLSQATYELVRDTPPEGVPGLLLEVFGWLGMLAAARIVTRRWLASSLVLTAWLLLVVGNSFGARLIQHAGDAEYSENLSVTVARKAGLGERQENALRVDQPA